jgi:YD repeat-containing protein
VTTLLLRIRVRCRSINYATRQLQLALPSNRPGPTANWRTRTFGYNSLSQLLTASNPESGTISYTYDNDGVVTSKQDARGRVL